jgi:hypothetical protein
MGGGRATLLNEPGDTFALVLSRLFLHWWWNADGRSATVLGGFALGLLSVWCVVVGILNLDQFSTVNAGTPLSVLIKSTAAGVAALLAARSHFGLRPEVTRDAEWLALRARPSEWAFRGCLWMAIAAGAYWWFGHQLVSIAAQHIPGTQITYRGTVIRVHEAGSRAKCQVSVTIRLEQSDDIDICLQISGSAPIGPPTLTGGDRVQVRTRITRLGEAVDSIEYDQPG